jgi:hypothetical protein
VCERRNRVVSQRVSFWLERDRGTMNARNLAVKFTSYASYIASSEWTREHMMLPLLICAAPDIAQEKGMQLVAQNSLTRSPGVMLWTTTAVLLKDHGPLAPIWLQSKPHSSQVVQSYRSFSQCLFKISNITLLDRQNLMPLESRQMDSWQKRTRRTAHTGIVSPYHE